MLAGRRSRSCPSENRTVRDQSPAWAKHCSCRARTREVAPGFGECASRPGPGSPGRDDTDRLPWQATPPHDRPGPRASTTGLRRPEPPAASRIFKKDRPGVQPQPRSPRHPSRDRVAAHGVAGRRCDVSLSGACTEVRGRRVIQRKRRNRAGDGGAAHEAHRKQESRAYGYVGKTNRIASACLMDTLIIPTLLHQRSGLPAGPLACPCARGPRHRAQESRGSWQRNDGMGLGDHGPPSPARPWSTSSGLLRLAQCTIVGHEMSIDHMGRVTRQSTCTFDTNGAGPPPFGNMVPASDDGRRGPLGRSIRRSRRAACVSPFRLLPADEENSPSDSSGKPISRQGFRPAVSCGV